MNEDQLAIEIEKYGWEGVIDRCTFKGEHCKLWFTIRKRGYSEHIVEQFYHLMMENYSEKSLRLMFMKVFMGGFDLTSDQDGY